MVRIFDDTIPQSSRGSLLIEEVHPGYNEIYFLPSKEALKDAGRNGNGKTLILKVNAQDDFVSIHPINTQPTNSKFLHPKYDSLETITLDGLLLDGLDYEHAKTEENLLWMLEALPSGFVKDYEYGLGYNNLVDTLEEWGIKHLVISQEEATKLDEKHAMLTLRYSKFEKLRKATNRIINEARRVSVDVRRITANNFLSSFLGHPESHPKKALKVKDTKLAKLIAKSSPMIDVGLTRKDQKGAVNLVSTNSKKIAEEQPETLIKLRNTIELVSLEELIERYQSLLDKKAKELTWQKLFQQNPFILSMAFSSPIIILQDQAYVGGIGISGSGGKISDFFGVNLLSRNTTIIEIKTPGAQLLNKKPYRDNVYTISKELAGSVNQVLDQCMKFQQEALILKGKSKDIQFEVYHTAGVLIIGTTPSDADHKQSFELFRGNSKDVVIVTFDELLEKLKQLLYFLKKNNKSES